jgi:hypothetical protein
MLAFDERVTCIGVCRAWLTTGVITALTGCFCDAPLFLGGLDLSERNFKDAPACAKALEWGDFARLVDSTSQFLRDES